MKHLFLMTFALLILSQSAFSQATGKSLKYISVQEKPLEEVMSLVANYSGYEILLLGDHGSSNITGVFYLADLERSLERIFKGTNIFIEFNEKEKKIVVKFPGQGLPVKISGLNQDSHGADKEFSYDDIVSVREREQKVQLERMSDPSEVDPDSGVSYMEQLAMREREQKVQLERMSDPSEVDPDSGVSYMEQLSMREREKKIQLERMSDPSEVDPDSGVSYMKQLSMREREQKEISDRTSNPDEIDFETGMTYGQLMLIRERENKY